MSSVGRWGLTLVEGDSIREAGLGLGLGLGLDGETRLHFEARGRIDAVRIGDREPSRSAVDVISLTGTVSAGELRMVLAGVDADGTLVAGPLTDARAIDLELTIEALEMSPPPPPPLTRPPSPVPRPRSPVSPPPSPSPSWSDVIAASQPPPDVAAEPIVELPRPGDQIEHSAFGLCRVQKLEADEDFVLVRSAQGRLLRLSLDVLRLEPLPDTDGVRRFRAAPREAARGSRPR